MAGHLAGKNIAVTGAGNGIGRAIALACAGEGANVVVADYGVSIEGSDPSSEVADAVVAEIAAAGGTAIAVAGDVSQMEVGQRIVDTAVENWGTIDGVACVAGIVRERMLFNMSEEEFDHVVAVHLKGHCIAPAAMTRMSENVPFEIEAGGPEAIAPLAVFLMSNAARDITAQIYTCTGKRIAVWNQPAELRHMLATDGEMFTVDEVAEKLPADVGVEEMPMFADLERRMKEMAEKKAAEESGAAS